MAEILCSRPVGVGRLRPRAGMDSHQKDVIDHGVPVPGAGARTVSLALQGGGAHGAFTWGVLDRLLEDDRLKIDGISATSAGAMNGAMLAYGMLIGGREGARKLLREFWERISETGRNSIFQPTML